MCAAFTADVASQADVEEGCDGNNLCCVRDLSAAVAERGEDGGRMRCFVDVPESVVMSTYEGDSREDEEADEEEEDEEEDDDDDETRDAVAPNVFVIFIVPSPPIVLVISVCFVRPFVAVSVPVIPNPSATSSESALSDVVLSSSSSSSSSSSIATSCSPF